MIKPARLEKQKDGTVKALYRLADLILDDNNARSHDERDLNAIAESVEQFDQQKPVVIDAEGVVRAGNGTCLALMARDQELVWGVQSNLKGAKAIAYALADNRTAELSSWDYGIVTETLKALESKGQDIQRLGWDEFEIENLLRPQIHPPSEDDSFDTEGLVEKLVVIKLTQPQHKIVSAAINHYRSEHGDGITDGKALEAICLEWLE